MSPSRRKASIVPKSGTRIGEKSVVEKVAGSLPALAGAAAIGARAGSPGVLPIVGALLPVLVNCLAQGRSDQRIRAWAEDVDAKLSKMRDHLNRFSDAQYRLTVGIIQTALETIDDEKLRLLKAAVLNVAKSDYLKHFEAQLFSRILRDISAGEIAFLAAHRTTEGFVLRKARSATDHPGLLSLDPKDDEASIVRGLINLGLAVRSPSEGTFSDVGAYLVAPFVPRLLDLVVEST